MIKLIQLIFSLIHLLKSGFTGVGYPKVTPIALAEYVEKNNLQGQLRFDLFVGASTASETEDR